MEWTQFIIFFLGVFGLFIWNRTEAREDIRHMDNKMESNKNLILEIHRETLAVIDGMRNEMKDFHYRMVSLEKEKEKEKKSKRDKE